MPLPACPPALLPTKPATAAAASASASALAAAAAEQETKARVKAHSQRRVRALLGIDERAFTPPPEEGPPEGQKGPQDCPANPGPSLGRHGLGAVRSLRAFEESLGVCFNPKAPQEEMPDSKGGTTAARFLPPCVVRADAQWGGLPADRFNETADPGKAVFLALAAAMQKQTPPGLGPGI
mmetsp:Transcript_67121/g.151777  ORF Transcript_67121/g.151777 Transcript_67121/m.151777 type:complete len:180 (-) Transcript_67121:143-682(-)